MTKYIQRTVSAESSYRLNEMRKSLAALRRAIPKDTDPGIKVEAVDSYNARLTAKWSEWI